MERLLVGLPYRGVVQQCLKKVKYQSQWDRINFLFKLWEKKIKDQMLGVRFQGDVVTSVPMWREKEGERGFNQAKIIGELLAEEYGWDYIDILERVRETMPMYGLKKTQRRENVGGAFRVQNQCDNSIVSRIILVDDVWTTGSTMQECTRVLKESGAMEVWGAILAR
ncbi:MAG: hypothetical protein ABII21_04015 [bacterium]